MIKRLLCFSAFYFRNVLLFLLCFFPFRQLAAQSAYPVQANAFFLSPYSLYLEDYENRNRLAVTLINTDLQYPSLQVRLQIILKAGGLTLTIPPQAYIPPITLTPGIAYRLSPEELAPYFRSMSPSGMGSSAFLKDRKLPQGMVELSVEVQEYFSRRRLSQPRTAFAWISAQKPPLLNLPYKGENLSYREPLNLLFQWAPQHTGLAMVEYELIIKQIWDNGLSPEAAWLYSPVICKESTRFTTLLYGPAMPMLTPGMTYVWAVRAVAKDGLDELRAFENNGLSEIRWFTLEEYCPPPLNLQAHAEKGYIYLEWTPLPEHREFMVSYRRKDLPGADWFSTKTVRSRLVIRDIRPGFMYEYRIGTCCKPGVPVYGPTFSIEVPVPVEEENPNCGVMKPIDLSNKELLPAITAGEMFTAADFPVYILEVNGSDGVFSGRGYTIMSKLFDGIKLEVTFDHIKINTDYRMIDGVVKGVSSPRKEQVSNLDTVVETLTNLIDSLASAIKHLDFTIGGEKEIQLKENPEALSDSNASKYIVEVNGVDGEKESLPVNSLPLVVEDGEGNQYKIDTNGKVSTLEYITISEENKSKYSFTIDETPYSNSSHYHTLTGDQKAITTIQLTGDYPDKEQLVWKVKNRSGVLNKIFSQYAKRWEKTDICEFPRLEEGNYELLIYNGKEALASLLIHIYTKPVVSFYKDHNWYTGEFGFDDGSELSLTNDYQKMKIGKTDYIVPWLGLLSGQTATLTISSHIPNFSKGNQEQIDTDFKIQIRSTRPDKITINNKSILELNYADLAKLKEITIKSDLLTDLPVFDGSDYLYILDHLQDTIGKLLLICSEAREQKVAIVKVKHDEKAGYRQDISIENVLDFINTKSHNQLFFKLDRDIRVISTDTLNAVAGYTQLINSDLYKKLKEERNYLLNERFFRVYTSELQKKGLTLPNETLILFITNLDMGTTGGMTIIELGCAMVGKDGPLKHYCHESAHNLGLPHPFCCYKEKERTILDCHSMIINPNRCKAENSTFSNYMDYGNKDQNSYYFYQWKEAKAFLRKTIDTLTNQQ